MAHVAQGDKLVDFIYQTAFEQNLQISDTVNRVEGKTAIAFLRYFGCLLCQYDMHQYMVNYDEIASTGGQLIVVLQSDPALVREQINEDSFPFDVICDKNKDLYQLFEIPSAPSKQELMNDDGRAFVQSLRDSGYVHGAYEGDEHQLPALFIVDHDLNVKHAHYATLATDMPDASGIAKLLK